MPVLSIESYTGQPFYQGRQSYGYICAISYCSMALLGYLFLNLTFLTPVRKVVVRQVIISFGKECHTYIYFYHNID